MTLQEAIQLRHGVRQYLDKPIEAEKIAQLQEKLFDADGEYRAIRERIERDPELTAVTRSRQLHIYRNGKKILVLAGRSAPKIVREDVLTKWL